MKRRRGNPNRGVEELTEQVALWRRNGEERARETPKAPTKVEVVGYWPNVERGGGKSGRHMERNKCPAATVMKRKEK